MKIQRFVHASLFLPRSVYNSEVAYKIEYQMKACELGFLMIYHT